MLPAVGLNPGTSVDGDLWWDYVVGGALLAAKGGWGLLVGESRSCWRRAAEPVRTH